MNNQLQGSQGGFILKVMMLVVGVGVIFIVMSNLARSLGQAGGTSFNQSPVSSDTNATNPLLKFLDDTGSSPGYGPSGNSDLPQASRSAYSGSIRLGTGNTYSIQPSEEYLNLRNSGKNAVNITGWTITNGKGTRPIQTRENDYVYPVADSARIGQGTEFLDPSGRYSVGSIVLRPGDSAILITGGPFNQFSFPLSTSFRENICVGYLKNYPFNPALTLSCPIPTNDPSIRTVTDQCYDYMASLNRCQEPAKYDKANYDAQTGQCRAFMDARLSYPACVATNRASAGFSTNQWRIFLGKTQELWSNRHETITLYDAAGLIVDQISY